MSRYHYRSATTIEQSQMAYALLSAVIDLGVASTDDAHQRYELPVTVEPRMWGAITHPLLADGVLCRFGDSHTRRRVAHGRRIGLYSAPDIDRARQYASRLLTATTSRRARQMTLPGMD